MTNVTEHDRARTAHPCETEGASAAVATHRPLWRRLGPTGLLGLLWLSLPGIAGIVLLANLGPASTWLTDRGGLGLAVYVGCFILAAGLGLLPTYAQAVLGGWVFGMVLGLPAALLGFTGAAVVGYGVTRGVSRDRIEQIIAEKPRWAAVREALVGRGFWRTLGIVALVRVPPNSPFALTNLVLASSGTRVVPFALGTLFGMLPRTAVTVGFAAAAAATGAADIQSFVKERGTLLLAGGIVTMIIVLAVIGHIASRAVDRVVNQPSDGS